MDRPVTSGLVPEAPAARVLQELLIQQKLRPTPTSILPLDVPLSLSIVEVGSSPSSSNYPRRSTKSTRK
jgi:hypothetical protein